MNSQATFYLTKTAPMVFPPMPAPKPPRNLAAMRELTAQGFSPAKAMAILEARDGHGKRFPEGGAHQSVPQTRNTKSTSARSIILRSLSGEPSTLDRDALRDSGLSSDTIYRAIHDLKAAGHIENGPYVAGRATYFITEDGTLDRLRRFGGEPVPLVNYVAVDARDYVLKLAGESFAPLNHEAIFAAGVSKTAGYNAVSNLVKCGHLERGERAGSLNTYRLTEAGKAERLRRFGA